MNIKEIAKLAGVSVATVSRVINNNPNVSSASKEKVLSVMAENNYTPNLFARGLNTKSINTVGILCPDIGDVNHARTVSSLEHSLREMCIRDRYGGYSPGESSRTGSKK